MKQKLKSLLLLIGVSLIIFPGCKKDGMTSSPSSISAKNDIINKAEKEAESDHQNSDENDQVKITFTYVTLVGKTTTSKDFAGTFTSDEGPARAGTVFMHTEYVGPETHCTTTLTTEEGTITTFEVCQIAAMIGVWDVIGSTGRYANVKGSGTLQMVFPPTLLVGIVGEVYSGNFWKRDNNHGEGDNNHGEGNHGD